MVAAAQEKTTGAENVIWDLSVFYQGVDDPGIQRDMEALNARVEAFAARYRGQVASLSGTGMLEAITEYESIQDASGRLGSFVGLTYNTDTNNPQFGALLQKLMEFGSQLRQKMLFFDLEWTKADDAVAQKLLNDPALAKYRHVLEAERRWRPYLLTEPEEQLLIDKSVTGRGAWSRFFNQVLGALRFDYDGQPLTQSQVLAKLYDTDRDVRHKAADSTTKGLESKAMELTYVFNTVVADKASDDRRRGYKSWISARNLDNLVSDETVEALVSTVTANYHLVVRHYDLKRRLLGYDKLYDYDRYAPMPVMSAGRDYTWAEASNIVLSAYRAFSPKAGEIVERFFDGHWIHAALAPGKRGGAFCSYTVPSAHPFVFLNYTGQNRDIMTLAHELGHGMHGYLALQTQGILNSEIPLTTAETASVFGEMLVFDDLMGKEPDPAARLAMLGGKLEDTFATVFRQIALNRFEDRLHTQRRSEGELTTEQISQIWLETQRDMFQGSVELRDDYGVWWTYISHFIGSPGYVYAYAYGELLVLALFNLYKERGADFVPQYLDVLAAGGSDYPERILAKVGVDLTDPNFWNEGIAAISALLDQEEQLARQVYPDKFQ
jgi:oligoendopeptidase F